MPNGKNRQLTLALAEYERLGEPDQAEKSQAWQTAIGLQQVDGLATSKYLLETAKEHIEGRINIHEAQARIDSYYQTKEARQNQDSANTREADIVASRIAKLLGEATFNFSTFTYFNIHKKLFAGLYPHAGKIRPYNITKKEWVLNGDTVQYCDFDVILDTLNYDFDKERKFSFIGLSTEQKISHISKFISNVWQIHPFCEGNTRTTAVFLIKYLKFFGFPVNNAPFAKNAWYFRNALVRANWSNMMLDIQSSTLPLEHFLRNVILGTNFELKNRRLHILYKDGSLQKEDTASIANEMFIEAYQHSTTHNHETKKLIDAIHNNPKITQAELAVLQGYSLSKIKRQIAELQSKGLLERIGGRKLGSWKILDGLELLD